MEHQGSKLKLILGGRPRNESNSRHLMGILKKGNTPLTHKQLVTFAYHFAINGDNISTRRFLKKIDLNYWTTGIYKDLYQALLCWSIRDTIWNKETKANYEYFVIVKKCLPVFSEFEFTSKKEFLEFKLEFFKETTVIK